VFFPLPPIEVAYQNLPELQLDIYFRKNAVAVIMILRSRNGNIKYLPVFSAFRNFL